MKDERLKERLSLAVNGLLVHSLSFDAIFKAIDEIDRLECLVAAQREALEQFAKEDNWSILLPSCWRADSKPREIAQAALALTDAAAGEDHG